MVFFYPSEKNKRFKNFLQSIWNFLLSQTGTFLIGVSAIAVGTYQFYINKPILKYQTALTNIVSSVNDNDLKVTIKEKEYKDLYQTTVVLSNTGEQALAGEDVSKIGRDPIRIVIPKKAKVVSYILDKNQTSPEVSVKLVPIEGAIVLDFDFLNPGSQIAVTLLHEYPDTDFVIRGSALNVTSIDREWNKTEERIFIISLVSAFYIFFIAAYILRRIKRRRS